MLYKKKRLWRWSVPPSPFPAPPNPTRILPQCPRTSSGAPTQTQSGPALIEDSGSAN